MDCRKCEARKINNNKGTTATAAVSSTFLRCNNSCRHFHGIILI